MTRFDTRPDPTITAPPRLDRIGCLLLIIGGIAFFASGPLHPQGADEGDKVEQLRSMLIDSAWYPAHAVGLLGFAGAAAGLLVLGRDPALRERLGRLLPRAQVIALIGALGAVVHLFAATQSPALEDGSTTPLVVAFMAVETLVNPVWSLMICALAVAGGRTRTLGNRLLVPVGVLGGAAFALATATIAYVDTFDVLFPIAGLIGVWLVAVGVVGLARRSS